MRALWHHKGVQRAVPFIAVSGESPVNQREVAGGRVGVYRLMPILIGEVVRIGTVQSCRSLITTESWMILINPHTTAFQLHGLSAFPSD